MGGAGGDGGDNNGNNANGGDDNSGDFSGNGGIALGNNGNGGNGGEAIGGESPRTVPFMHVHQHIQQTHQHFHKPVKIRPYPSPTRRMI